MINRKSPAHVAYSMGDELKKILCPNGSSPTQESTAACRAQTDVFLDQLLTDRNVSIETIYRTIGVWLSIYSLPLDPAYLTTFNRFDERCHSALMAHFYDLDKSDQMLRFSRPEDM